MLPVDGGSARDLRAAAIAADPARQLTGLTPPPTGPTPARRLRAGDFFSLPEKRGGRRSQPCPYWHVPDGSTPSFRWSSGVCARCASVGFDHATRVFAIEIRRLATKPSPVRKHKESKNPSEGALARASALADLWAGRLVDRVGCGALSTGVTAGSRALQSLVAGADRIAALALVLHIINLHLTHHSNPNCTHERHNDVHDR